MPSIPTKTMPTSQGGSRKKVGDYVLGKTLGRGTYGKVKRAIHGKTLELVAVKVMRLSKDADMEVIEKEISVLKLLKHPNVVKLIDVIRGDQKIYIVLELVTGGELFDRIVQEGYLIETDARKLFRQMVSVIEYCHGNLIAHRDIKPENILLDGEGNVKVTDFGLCNFIKPGEFFQTSCGSPVYAAPEVILNSEGYVGTKSDIWSMGVVLFAMVAGHLPFEVDNKGHLLSIESLLSGKFPMPRHLSAELADLLLKMINPDPVRRATLEQIKNHAWVNTGYLFPPPCYLEHRSQGVDRVNEEVFQMLRPLKFDMDAARTAILLNDQCLATSVYHLFLEQMSPKLEARPAPQPRKPTRRLSLSLPNVPEPGADASVFVEAARHRRPVDHSPKLSTLSESDDTFVTNPINISSPVGSPSPRSHIQTMGMSPTNTGMSPINKTKSKLSEKVMNIFKRKAPATPPPVHVPTRRHSTDVAGTAERQNIFDLGKSMVLEMPVRTVKNPKNVVTLKGKILAQIVESVEYSLQELGVTYEQEGYLYKCKHEAAVNGASPVIVTFDVEICKVKSEADAGVKIKRSGGDIWAYKPIVVSLTNKLREDE